MRTAASLIGTLKRTFGIAGLRPGEREVIDSIVAGHYTLAIMATGAGKSLSVIVADTVRPVPARRHL